MLTGIVTLIAFVLGVSARTAALATASHTTKLLCAVCFFPVAFVLATNGVDNSGIVLVVLLIGLGLGFLNVMLTHGWKVAFGLS